MGYIFMQMEENMKVNLKMIRKKDLEKKNILMEIYILVNLKII